MLNITKFYRKYFWIYIFIRVLLVVIIFLILSFTVFTAFHERIKQARITAIYTYMEENNIYDIVWGLDDFYIRQYFEWIGSGFRTDCGLSVGH